MKKLMKALAFALVMCLALTTAAFASTELVSEKVLKVTVDGAGNDQVALVVVASDAANNDFSNPLYIDQQGAVDGAAEFTAVLTNADVDAVDIYVGYATYAATYNAPAKIGEDVAITEGITEVTIEKIDAEFIQASADLKAEDQTGSAAILEFSVEAPEGVSATSMIWAIRYFDEKENKEVVKYTDAIDASDCGLGGVVSGAVKLGVAFINGSDFYGIDPVEITGVDAIFLFSNDEVEFTNSDDAANELK